MDTSPLRDAYRTLLDAAAVVADSGPAPLPPEGEWNADQILAHVTLVNAATLATVCAVASGTNATFDNRILLDTWTIDRAIERAGGNAGLRSRIQLQADALCALGGPALSEAELGTNVPVLVLSHDALLRDDMMPLRELVMGLAEVELPMHAKQLLALLPDDAVAAAAS